MNDRTASKPFRLVQLSDCHLQAEPGIPYRGASADRGLGAMVAATAAWRPDAVLLTGDVSEDASAPSYARASSMLAGCGARVLALPGNHDRPDEMRRHFPTGPWTGPRVESLGAWRLVLLDSTVPGRVDGRVSVRDIEWLASWLAEEASAPVLVALHHQPVPVGSPWIDRYRLQAPEDFLEVVAAHARVRAVVWGHVHQDFESDCGAARLLACPSTAANSLPQTERFTADAAGPAGRWLDLRADGSMRTGLLRAEPEFSGAAARATG